MPSKRERLAMPTKQEDLVTALANLRQSSAPPPWPQRRQYAASLPHWLANGANEKLAVKLAHALVKDPKWEVRKEVADALIGMPGHDYARLTATLLNDTNSFVQAAAQRAHKRRCRGEAAHRRQQQTLDHLESEYRVFEQLHGQLAADKARHLGERQYDLLVGAVVHDMRGVLTPIKASSHKLRKNLDNGQLTPELCRKDVQRLVERSALLERLLDDMQIYSQLSLGTCHQERLAELVREATKLASEQVQRDPRAVSQHVPVEITLVACRHQILRALVNVIKNALEASDDGEVDIEGHVVDDRIQVVVRDQGIGMSEEDLATILLFAPGHSSKKTRGTGFGLPTTKRILQSHGGSIQINSELNRGTTVTLTLLLDASRTTHDLQSTRNRRRP